MTKSSNPNTSQPLLDLQRIAVAIRRRRRFWMFAALLGLLAGAVLAVLVPAKPTAVTRLLIVHEADQPSDGGGLMRTDVALLQTTRIAGEALKKLDLTENPEDFLKTYQGTGLTSNVLELTVEGSNDRDAVARAQALADVFIADHVRRLQAGADAEAKALIDQRNRAQAELAQVDASIAAIPPEAAGQTAAELESLFARRAELTSQVSDLGRRAEEAGIGAPRVAAGTQIVDAPRALPQSLLKTGVTNGAIGLVLGLTLGLGLAAVAGVVRDRPVLRREIAVHLGASVIAQLPKPRRGPPRLWRRSRAVADRKRVAGTLVRAVRNGPGALSLLEIGCPRTAAALAMDIAEDLAVDGSVVIVDDLPRRNLHRLSGDSDGPVRILRGDKENPIRILVLDGGGGRHRPVWPGERHIGVGSVEPGTPWTDLEHLGSETVLVVRAGYANTLWLHTVARQLADSGIPVIGVVLVHPDPRDRTDGTLWDGLHTALRGRAARGAGSTSEAPKAVVPSPVKRQPIEIEPTANTTNGSANAGSVARNSDTPTERFTPVEPVKIDE